MTAAIRRILIATAASLGLTTLASCAPTMTSNNPVTLAIVNARVWTANPRQPWASGLAIAGDRIVAAGASAEIAKLARSQKGVRVIDANGGLVTPGFIDSHVHFIDGGYRLSSVQLRDAKSPQEFVARIKAYAATLAPGTWITGGDWDHQQWGGELPRRDWIDSVTPRNPVWVSRLDGHMALANSAALAAAKVTKATKDVEGGTIVRDAAGEPTGIFKDNAQSYVNDAEPPRAAELDDRALKAAMTYVSERGVTSVHNMGGFADLAAFERAHAAGSLITRIFAVTPISQWERLRDTVERRGKGDEWVRIGGLKGFVDGSLGSHTAAMFAPFTDTPADSGFLVETEKDLYTWTSRGDRAGLQLIVHAIGDRAINTQLNIFERVAQENGARDRRFRIEHAQHIAPADIARFAKLGVIPSMQPYHAIDDGRWAEKVIGAERAKTTYAFRSLRDAGARLAFGSDWFVAPPTPIEGIYAAVTRRTLDDRNPNGWVPEQKIDVEDALRAYTINAAYASFEEGIKGSIERGKLADIVLIDRDITRVPPETIRQARVRLTIVGGRVVFEAH
ncbi:MAG TPA: amidohydrolase [Gemmatimonadaceae bacterium]|nr:amidohydrolase [Gemmatimonadaceae bacterium]